MTIVDPKTGEIRETTDAQGREIPDPNPLELPLGFKRPETLAEQVQRLVRNSVSEYARLHGHETFEESEDFDVGDDFDPSTPYELDFDPVLQRDIAPADFRDPEKREYFKKAYLEAERNAIRAEARQEAINEAYRASRKRGAGVSPAPSPSSTGASQAPPAEPLSGRKSSTVPST